MKIFKLIPLLIAMFLALSTISMAEDTAREIEDKSNEALIKFYIEVKNGKKLLDNAKGYVIFPEVTEGGLFLGGKYGEGALRIGGVTKGYFRITAASLGMLMGVQQYSLIIAFTTEKALNKFIHNDNWKSDFDANAAVAEWNADEESDDVDFGSGMVGFVYDSKGMMGNFSFEGTRFERITPDFD